MDTEIPQDSMALTGGAPPTAKASYDAASHGRRLKGWAPGSPGPTRAVVGQMSTVRARSRDAGRNNGWIANGVRNWVSNEVGAGIKPRSRAPNAAFAAEANRLWEEEFRAAADYDGTLDVYGLMALAVRSRKESGEVFVRIRHLGLASGAPVPVQFQLIESDQVPHTHNELRQDREIVAGVEFNLAGQRTNYWMYRRHPFDMAVTGMELVQVPAADVIHHFAPLRPGQVRGMAETVQALIKARDFDEYDDAELTRKKTRANYTGTITRAAYDDSDFQFDPFTGEPLDGGAAPMVNIEPGTFPALLPGEEIKLFEGDQGGAYGEFMRQQLMGVAASLGIPYELLSGDMRNVNDRVLRALLNEYRRLIEQSQWLYTIPQLCQRMWDAFIDAAVLSGRLKARDYATNRRAYLACDWRPHAWRYMHPVQDAQGELMLIKGGLGSRAAAAAERGYDVEDIDRQNKADTDRAQGLGLQYSHDPIKVDDE
ncbi:phage portal protein [Pseudomonas sp. MAP12]|uniref:Phage portal protein n=1 Tax=Geopseudomonas aromaticivorans TaxID=2849492 RepID=A0ABS6MUN0_9GAMM|nr:phage portal protein [Pseudomonas aromaticivorans]MBV2132041.1 phage portal protein [Pseudomonas aromaticivorans]